MRWLKRLKWLRISKVVIPVTLAASLVFAGFSVYSKQAQNFVIRTTGASDINLQLAMEKDLSDATSRLAIPITGSQTHNTFMKDDYNYTIDNRTSVIPNDIALRNGVTQGIDADSSITYTAFSFYVINYSGFPIDVELSMNLDSLNYNNTSSYHVDDALRIMVIEGEHYLTEETYTIYAKPEKNAEDEAALSADEDLYGKYYTTTDWYSDEIIFKRTNQNGIVNLADGDYVKFTIVMWLEGRDVACSNSIYGEMAKLSMDFVGY